MLGKPVNPRSLAAGFCPVSMSACHNFGSRAWSRLFSMSQSVLVRLQGSLIHWIQHINRTGSTHDMWLIWTNIYIKLSVCKCKVNMSDCLLLVNSAPLWFATKYNTYFQSSWYWSAQAHISFTITVHLEVTLRRKFLIHNWKSLCFQPWYTSRQQAETETKSE